jgi:hypothetical protein
MQLSEEWLATRERLREAQQRWEQAGTPTRVLLVNGASRNDGTCPGEMSKTYRLTRIARDTLAKEGIDTDLLDLSWLQSDYARTIHPCKGCVSTAMPLCHWPCSCYPNHALGQSNDWMAEIYERWVAAHGVLVLTPTVPVAQPAEADDRPPRLRRRRQSGSHQHRRQGRAAGQGARAGRLAHTPAA